MRGSVVDKDGRPALGVLVMTHVQWTDPAAIGSPVNSLLPDRVWTDQHGQFEAVLPSEGWRFPLTAGRYLDGRMQRAAELVDAKTEQPLRLELQWH